MLVTKTVRATRAVLRANTHDIAWFAFLLTQSDRSWFWFNLQIDASLKWEVCYASNQESIKETQPVGEGSSRHGHKD
jgi:hypothetical protein